MSANAIYIFPWQTPFLPGLKRFIEDSGDPGSALVITPNMRPARYLVDLFRRDKKACLLPKMITIDDLVTKWRPAFSCPPVRMASELDQVGLLYECVQETSLEDGSPASRFSNMDIGTFMPWGRRLAQALETLLIEGQEINSLKAKAKGASGPAAALLDSLGLIGAAYMRKLEERHWTTRGLDHKFAAENAATIPPLLAPTPERPVIIAGFYILSKTHNELLKSLWQHGARVCFHTDPALAERRDCDWACSGHAQWIESWQATPVLVDYAAKVERATEFSFFAGYDLHSQLEKMKAILDNNEPRKVSTAIIPGKKDTLMALLQSLPEGDVNVSVGYPMNRAPLSRLLEDILTMRENAIGSSLLRAEDVLKVVRHPYLNKLKAKDEEGNTVYLSNSLRSLDYEIRKTGRYWQLDSKVGPKGALAAACLRRMASFFANVETLSLLAKAIEDLCAFLADAKIDARSKRNRLDLEVMHRLVHKLLPVLRNSALSGQILPFHAARRILHQLIVDERIPFEAEPMRGLQVIGMLESRLLNFDRIIFLDATEDVLPGAPAPNPLLPDSLRRTLGMPDSATREREAAYNFFRLCQGAREAHLLWREGVPKSDFYDSKKVRSRFVEQLLWKREKPRLERDEPANFVELPSPLLKICQKQPRTLSRSPELTAAIENFWNNLISVTSLDGYLGCPLSFIRQHVIGLNPRDRSPARASGIIGEFVHKILEYVYKSLGPEVDKSVIDDNGFMAAVREAFARAGEEMELPNRVPVDAWMTLKRTVPAKLHDFWKKQPDKTRILAAEPELFKGEISLGDRRLKLKGKPDRLDLRAGAVSIIDYKTNSYDPSYDSTFWESENFFKEAAAACQSNDLTLLEGCFAKLRAHTQSLQLPLYLLMLQDNALLKEDLPPGNACIVPLSDGGEEKWLFSSPIASATDPRLEHCRIAVNLVRAHMLATPGFTEEKTVNCGWCRYAELCAL